MVPPCILCCTDTVFISLGISSITPTKSTFFIHYISIPCFSYMLRCILHHLLGELTCSLLNNTCFYTDTLYATVVESQNTCCCVVAGCTQQQHHQNKTMALSKNSRSCEPKYNLKHVEYAL
jgi:hypothetical protein